MVALSLSPYNPTALLSPFPLLLAFSLVSVGGLTKYRWKYGDDQYHRLIHSLTLPSMDCRAAVSGTLQADSGGYRRNFQPDGGRNRLHPIRKSFHWDL